MTRTSTEPKCESLSQCWSTASLSNNVFEVTDDSEVLAVVVKAAFTASGVNFFTSNHLSQQLGVMRRSAGTRVAAHRHKRPEPAELSDLTFTQEVLIVKCGRIAVELFNRDRQLISRVELGEGDVILIAGGFHSVEFLVESEIIEVKQGPYSDQSKISMHS